MVAVEIWILHINEVWNASPSDCVRSLLTKQLSIEMTGFIQVQALSCGLAAPL